VGDFASFAKIFAGFYFGRGIVKGRINVDVPHGEIYQRGIFQVKDIRLVGISLLKRLKALCSLVSSDHGKKLFKSLPGKGFKDFELISQQPYYKFISRLTKIFSPKTLVGKFKTSTSQSGR